MSHGTVMHFDFELPPGYRVGKSLRSGPASRTLAAVRAADGRPVVLKVYGPSAGDNAHDRARRELETLRVLAGPGVPRALDLHLELPRPVLVVEHVRGRSAHEWAAREPPPIDAALRVGIELAGILERVHCAHFLHRDICPTNLVVEPLALAIQLLDFGFARRLGVTSRGPRELSGTIEGSLHYLSPEQTGRMNRGCDPRSDLYSLGATLYFLLTGHAPFESDDPLELIHAHLARRAPSPRELRAEIPDALAQVVLKLLEKEPDDRYQSARSVRMDLEHILARFEQAPASLAAFVPGAFECPDRPRFPGRIFGREPELRELRAAYARAASGRLQLVSLRGASGSGKSALVQQLRDEISRSRGYLASGKFDQVRDRPYAGWQAALGSLLQQILVASDALLTQWRQELTMSLGSLAGALQPIAPDLGFVLDDVPALPRVGPAEARARLTLALERLLRAAATRNHPLVVFLDDVQWGDAGSLHLLEQIVMRVGDAALLLVTAERPDEIGPDHALTQMRDRLAALEVAPISIALGPLERTDTLAMLAGALERTEDSLCELASCIERKTGNNPLLIRELVDTLCTSGVLRYEQGLGWVGDMEEIEAADVPEGAVALLTPKIEALDAAARELLTLASWAGDEFDADLLCEMCPRPREEIESALFALNDAGLLVPCDVGFRFAHDRIREAAISRLGDTQRTRLHMAVARALLQRAGQAEASDRIFQLADHFEACAHEITDDLREQAIQTLLVAGSLALGTGAAQTAERYFAAGRRLVGRPKWDADARKELDLWMQSAEAAYQQHDADACDRHLRILETLDLPVLDGARVATKRAQWLTLTRGATACSVFALARLRELGIRLPLRPTRARAVWDLWRADRALSRVPGAESGDLPAPTQHEPRFLAALLLIAACASAFARFDGSLGVLGLTSALRLELRHGFLGSPGLVLAAHALYTYVFLGRAARARRLAELTLRINARQPAPQRGRVEVLIHGFLNPFLMSRRAVVSRLEPGGRLCEECGDMEYAFYARRLRALFLALGGNEVLETQEVTAADMVLPGLSGDLRQDMIEVSRAYSQLAAPRIDLAELNAALEESEQRAPNVDDGHVYPRTMWMMVLTVYGCFDRVLELSDRVGARLWTTSPFSHVIDHCFYRALAAAHLATGARGLRRRRLLRTLRRARRVIARYGRHGPDFVHMRTLIDAERARLRGRHAPAIALYERAAREAMKQQFVHHAALASERVAELLRLSRRTTDARAHLSKAADRYRTWGAIAKADALAETLAALDGA